MHLKVKQNSRTAAEAMTTYSGIAELLQIAHPRQLFLHSKAGIARKLVHHMCLGKQLLLLLLLLLLL
jgi:hypothetical protein